MAATTTTLSEPLSAIALVIPVITLQDVNKVYIRDSSAVAALSNINLEVGAQEFVALVGPTGCGKTTLLRIIGGLIEPTAGTVLIDQKRVHGPSRSVGLVFQRPVLLPWRTVEENLSLPGELTGLASLENHDRIQELLRATGLFHYRHFYPREISVGMQQMASFCVALILDPDILLMDEPFSALDALTREQLDKSLLDLWSNYRKTVLFVTHSIEEAVFLSDRVVILSPRPGKVVQSVSVPLCRPRSIKMLESSEFLKVTTRVREVLDLGGWYASEIHRQ